MAMMTHCSARIGAAGRTGRKRSLTGKKRVIWTFIGGNFATAFLQLDGARDAETSIEVVIDRGYIVEQLAAAYSPALRLKGAQVAHPLALRSQGFGDRR